MFLSSILYSLLTIILFQSFIWLQKRTNKIWLNPMLLTILSLIVLLLFFNISYRTFEEGTTILSQLIEPAVVMLGYPLYQHIHTMRSQWKQIIIVLLIAAFLAITVSYTVTEYIIKQTAVSVSISLKSITTAIGIALTEQLNGNSSITAFAIILAGLFGATFGIKWLTFIKVTSPIAQGLAVGTASHALGTATVSQLSYQHTAYSSLALIVSATVTAIIAPFLIPLIQLFL